ncbi:MAG: sigma-54-dependent Fis family transcriptional regulator [Holophaga sp.]|nr:sigma-54-dependent Fis family transcriptional regulator [Holophaga sp.]
MKPFPTSLRAPWLGSWKAPWELGRGRRWGDPAWALAALTQAWLLGGREGQWPTATWTTGRSGPRIEAWAGFSPRPEPAWIALLRHGTTEIPAEQRGKKEDELRAWCWQSLLEGDGAPWMSLGATLISRAERIRWIPVLAAVDESGNLHLPPFLELLLPPWLLHLPAGWWEGLLGGMDGGGRLLPCGVPPADLPWSELFAKGPEPFEPLLLQHPSPELLDLAKTPWLHEISGKGMMLDPRLRAWARGYGACAPALDALAPQTLASGGDPSAPLRLILDGIEPVAGTLPDPWLRAIRADLLAEPLEGPPANLGEPTLDRLAMRWGGNPPLPSHGYPMWGEVVHPCADPFHWMSEGRQCFVAQDMEKALRAFAWAHAHFERLGSSFWAERAAANAMHAALFWGDLPAMARWRTIQGPAPSPFKELDEALLLAMREEWDQALPMLHKLCLDYPGQEQPWLLVGFRGLALGLRDWVEEVLPHIQSPATRTLFMAFLDGFKEPPPPELDGETTLMWWHFLSLRKPEFVPAFWQAWQRCPHRPLRLQTGLDLLEKLPKERTADRLLKLQVLADRAGSLSHQARLQPLWPTVAVDAPEDPLVLVKEGLAHRTLPAWLVWGPTETPIMLGHGASPPQGALSRLHRDGGLAPFEHQGLLWRGFPLLWEGGVVGHALAALAPDEPPSVCAELHLLAPWIALLLPRSLEDPLPEAGSLLMDGSEPMASLMRELGRVAPSELSLLIQGPTGSGKELTAREIHRRSGRTGALVAVNCSAFAESLLESELFGHVKGAFTGADRDRRGAIEAADKGTLFLDEVADLSPRIQSLFLRVLQEREVRRVGSDRATHVDVRFVAATHRPLEQLAELGSFRRDLLFRLQGSVLTLPSLRERRHEFPFLIPRLLGQVAREAKREMPDLSPGLAQALARLPWPGNFRELRHALERALLRCGKGTLKVEHFPELLVPEVRSRTWEQSTREFQKRLLNEALRQHHFQVTDTAEALGITRPALYLAAKRVGLDVVAARENWESERG